MNDLGLRSCSRDQWTKIQAAHPIAHNKFIIPFYRVCSGRAGTEIVFVVVCSVWLLVCVVCFFTQD